MSAHTPTPWRLSPRVNDERVSCNFDSVHGDGHNICNVVPEGDAAFIVRACNSHAQLVEALIRARRQVELRIEDLRAAGGQPWLSSGLEKKLAQIDAALAAAKVTP